MNFLPIPRQQVFYQQVWNLARQVPEGKVATYGQLAKNAFAKPGEPHPLVDPVGFQKQLAGLKSRAEKRLVKEKEKEESN